MGFRSGAYATVWEVRQGEGNYTGVRLSISRKEKETGEYYTVFSAWTRFIGSAHTHANELGERSRIRLGDVDVTNKYDKEKETTYTNYAVFSFEDANGGGTSSPKSSDGVQVDEAGFMTVSDEYMDELPFA